jgi:hypothetical protein
MDSMVLEHGLGGARLNTGTMTDHSDLAATLRANFRTIHFPRTEDSSRPPDDPHSDWWEAAKARRAERLAIAAFRQRLCQELVAHGHRRFLDNLEPDPEGGWRFHIFVADDHALSILADISEGRFGPGDPVDFDPEEFVTDHLNRTERLGSGLA